ncbi:hypothetical protein ABK040_004701 [Willaertia magna]
MNKSTTITTIYHQKYFHLNIPLQSKEEKRNTTPKYHSTKHPDSSIIPEDRYGQLTSIQQELKNTKNIRANYNNIEPTTTTTTTLIKSSLQKIMNNKNDLNRKVFDEDYNTSINNLYMNQILQDELFKYQNIPTFRIRKKYRDLIYFKKINNNPIFYLDYDLDLTFNTLISRVLTNTTIREEISLTKHSFKQIDLNRKENIKIFNELENILFERNNLPENYQNIYLSGYDVQVDYFNEILKILILNEKYKEAIHLFKNKMLKNKLITKNSYFLASIAYCYLKQYNEMCWCFKKVNSYDSTHYSVFIYLLWKVIGRPDLVIEFFINYNYAKLNNNESKLLNVFDGVELSIILKSFIELIYNPMLIDLDLIKSLESLENLRNVNHLTPFISYLESIKKEDDINNLNNKYIYWNKELKKNYKKSNHEYSFEYVFRFYNVLINTLKQDNSARHLLEATFLNYLFNINRLEVAIKMFTEQSLFSDKSVALKAMLTRFYLINGDLNGFNIFNKHYLEQWKKLKITNEENEDDLNELNSELFLMEFAWNLIEFNYLKLLIRLNKLDNFELSKNWINNLFKLKYLIKLNNEKNIIEFWNKLLDQWKDRFIMQHRLFYHILMNYYSKLGNIEKVELLFKNYKINFNNLCKENHCFGKNRIGLIKNGYQVSMDGSEYLFNNLSEFDLDEYYYGNGYNLPYYYLMMACYKNGNEELLLKYFNEMKSQELNPFGYQHVEEFYDDLQEIIKKQ